jgi:two-component system, response regulator PdtaR
VLLVEDDARLRRIIGRALRREGFQVFEFATCDEALAQLSAHPEVRIVLTDVQTPGDDDGYALARHVVARCPHMAVLVMSGRIGPRPGQLPRGAKFLAKPFALESLMALVHDAVSARGEAGDAGADEEPAGPERA